MMLRQALLCMRASCLQHTKYYSNMQLMHDICASAVALLQEQQQQDAYLRNVNACMQHNAPEGDTCGGSLASLLMTLDGCTSGNRPCFSAACKMLVRNRMPKSPESMFGGPGCSIKTAVTLTIQEHHPNETASNWLMCILCQTLLVCMLCFCWVHTGNLKASLIVCATVGPGNIDGM